jgi:CheY-like chemotaxis protein
VADKILVIDDSKVIRMRVRDMLPQGDFEVLEAGDGLEGLNLIRNQRPNLIMLDFLMPRMSGWEVFQEMQNHPELRTIPLVVMSGRKEEVTEKLSEPFEFFEFIEKPFEQKELLEAIKSAMIKVRRLPAISPVNLSNSTLDANAAAEIQALQSKVATLQAEINLLKKQLVQIVTFLRNKGL